MWSPISSRLLLVTEGSKLEEGAGLCTSSLGRHSVICVHPDKITASFGCIDLSILSRNEAGCHPVCLCTYKRPGARPNTVWMRLLYEAEGNHHLADFGKRG